MPKTPILVIAALLVFLGLTALGLRQLIHTFYTAYPLPVENAILPALAVLGVIGILLRPTWARYYVAIISALLVLATILLSIFMPPAEPVGVGYYLVLAASDTLLLTIAAGFVGNTSVKEYFRA